MARLKVYNPVSNPFKLERNNLSATKPQEILSLNEKTQNQIQMKMKPLEKSILKVYVDEDGKYFVEHAAAYALGLTSVRAIMINRDPSLKEITKQAIDRLDKARYQIEYSYLESTKQESKQTLRVYVDEVGDQYIDLSAAYALGLITVQTFQGESNPYYKLDESMSNLISSYDKEIKFIQTNETEKSSIKK